MKPQISIIVPVYNAEPYLHRCINSLLGQKLQDFEIIAVNDGSTDRSEAILRQYAEQDPRIHVLTQTNGGVSSARNLGLQAAVGKYIGFVDPDDWIDESMYETLAAVLEEQSADIVMCSYTREYETHSLVKKYPVDDILRWQGNEVKEQLVRRLIGPLGAEVARPEMMDAWGTVWSKLYRGSIIRDNGLQFTDLRLIGTNEDGLFNMEAAYHAGTFVFVNQPLYHYWKGNGTSLTSAYKANLLSKFLTQYYYMENFVVTRELGPSYTQAIHNRVCLNTLGLGLNTLGTNGPALVNQLREIKLTLMHPRFREAFLNLDYSHFSLIWRTFYLCAKWRVGTAFYFMLQGINILRRIVK